MTKTDLRQYTNEFHQSYATSRRIFHNLFYFHKSSTMNANTDDVPILNIEATNDVMNHDTILIPSISLFRPRNVLCILVFIEFLYVTIVWLIGITFSSYDCIIFY